MPELPEVEHLRRSLEPALVGSRVERVEVRRRDVIVAPGDPEGGFSRQRPGRVLRPVPLEPGSLLERETPVELARRGKQLAIVARSGRALVVHLGMSGTLTVGDRPEHDPHCHVTWHFEGGDAMHFRDHRRFGGIWTLPDRGALDARWSRLGSDALTLRAAVLRRILNRAQRPLKACLLDQTKLAGVGNIYADEACFRAKLHPAMLACEVSAEACSILAQAIRKLLRDAIERGGSTLRDYRDGVGRAGSASSLHRVYGRAGERCTRCCGQVESFVLAGRTTHACPLCQAGR